MNKIIAIVIVALGAASYGILATTIKLAYGDGHETASLTFLQFLFGILFLTVSSMFLSKKTKEASKKQTTQKYPKLKLMLFGISLALTSIFYYLSIKYVPVSVGIILLMQTVWMGVILEYFIDKSKFNKKKLIGSMVVLIGTLLASKVFEADFEFNFLGFLYGFLAAISYTISLYATHTVSTELPNIIRSKYLVLGGFLAILLIWNVQIIEVNYSLELLKYGVLIAIFGTILPPILFNIGVPVIGAGLSSIIATIEIPISIFSAYLLLDEQVGRMQFIGILLILITIIVINLNKKVEI